MNTKPSQHLEFAPPPQPGAGRSWLAAGLVHGLLFLALGLATAWKTQPQTVQAEAELWSATAQAAAPRLQEPPAEAEPEPKPQPEPKPIVKPSPPPPPAPDPQIERRDAQIALEKKKQQEKKKEAEKAEKLKAEKEKKAKEKADKEKVELKRKEREKEREKEDKAKGKEKAAKEKKAQEEKERDKKKAAEKADAAKFEALRADAHKDQMKNIQKGLAGASGGENASGKAIKSTGASASYEGRIVALVRGNIIFSGTTLGNPRAEVTINVSPEGIILSSRITVSSGDKAWDEAVLRAVQKTEAFPKDTNGRIPDSIFELGFRPQQ